MMMLSEQYIKTLFFFLLLFASVFRTTAQSQNSRMSIDLYRKLHTDSEYDAKLPVLLKGDTSKIKSLLLNKGDFYKYAVGDICSAEISLITIKDLLEEQSLKRIEYKEVLPADLFYEDSTADVNNNLYPVHNGNGILPYGFMGEGVILGIIDDGFEWRHPDFLNEDSSSRFLYFWDQKHVNSNYYEDFYAYGSSWDKTAIDSGFITHSPLGHGSHVLGTATGNARAAGKYIGIAPKSDIIAVAINENSGSFLSSFVDGAHYIFSKAASLGMPAAINSSVGTYFGSHDGKDLYTALLDSMLGVPGRTLVQAGGNARQQNLHWRAENLSPNDTSRIWMQPVSISGKTISFLYSDTSDFNNMNFSFEWIDRNTFQQKGATMTYNVLNDFDLSQGIPSMLIDTLFFINGFPVVLTMYLEQWQGTYELYFEILNLQNSNDYWQLTLSGQGMVDIWSSQTLIGSSNLIMNGNADHYINPDNIQSIVGFWTCSENVVTVSSYQNMAWLENFSGDTVALFTAGWLPPGISHFSSLGPTRDGRQKPDLTAPGGKVMSAAPLNTLNTYRNIGFTFLDKEGWHVSNAGTSMAAPMVTGAAALYLQCRPNASSLEIKNALRSAARLDSFVFVQSQQLPNVHWGYGKLDVYNLISGCMIYGCTDSSALNYNPAAHLDDGSCYLPLGLELSENDWELYPNPNNGSFTIKLGPNENQIIQIFDMRAVQLHSIKADKGGVFNVDLNLPAGNYIVKLNASKNTSYKKLIIK